MDLLKIDPGLMVWTWVTFGLLLFLLSKFAFPNMLKGLKDRERTINESLNNAAEIKQRLEALEAERQDLLKQAQGEAEELMRRARLAAEDASIRSRRAAETEALDIIAQARLKIEEERAAMVEGLRIELATFVCDSTEKLVERSFLSEEDRAWTRELSKVL